MRIHQFFTIRQKSFSKLKGEDEMREGAFGENPIHPKLPFFLSSSLLCLNSSPVLCQPFSVFTQHIMCSFTPSCRFLCVATAAAVFLCRSVVPILGVNTIAVGESEFRVRSPMTKNLPPFLVPHSFSFFPPIRLFQLDSYTPRPYLIREIGPVLYCAMQKTKD